MSNASPGPREYTQGTRSALFAFAGATCYFPGCDVPVIKFVNDEPVINTEIAHIYGANDNSPRYDDSMTDDQRRAFENLILLCTPHHKWVDRLHPEDYPVEVLKEWKRERESTAGIDNIALSSLTEDHLIELIERAVRSAGSGRAAVTELKLGLRMADSMAVLPDETANDSFRAADFGQPVLAVVVRNTGGLKSYVQGFRLRLDPDGFTLHYGRGIPQPVVDGVTVPNPPLPFPLDVGENRSWCIPVDYVAGFIRLLRRAQPSLVLLSLVGEVDLASGETILTPALPMEYLGEGLSTAS